MQVTQPLTVHDLADVVRDRRPITFVRYGNGEWDCVLGTNEQTGSRSQYFTPMLRQEMAETLINHDGKIMATQSLAYLKRCGLLKKANQWMIDHGLSIDWAHGDVLHYASRDGMLYPFIEALRERDDLVLVGPEWLHRLDIDHCLVSVPSTQAYAVIDPIINGLSILPLGTCVCLSVGPAAKIIAHRLRGLGLTVIDCGSIWDVYCWRPSRKYHHAMTSKIIEANLYG